MWSIDLLILLVTLLLILVTCRNTKIFSTLWRNTKQNLICALSTQNFSNSHMIMTYTTQSLCLRLSAFKILISQDHPFSSIVSLLCDWFQWIRTRPHGWWVSFPTSPLPLYADHSHLSVNICFPLSKAGCCHANLLQFFNVQWNLDLSFPQRSFSRMYRSPVLVPNDFPYK